LLLRNCRQPLRRPVALWVRISATVCGVSCFAE
jgi:hypothetical protein